MADSQAKRSQTQRRIRDGLAARGGLVFPSLLACDFGDLRAEIDRAAGDGVLGVQWDVMDGHFVPNLTYGPPIVKSLRAGSELVFDAHLMMDNPAEHVDAFLDAGCDSVTVHVEAVPEPAALLEKIRSAGALAGLAFNPGTDPAILAPHLQGVDLVLAMSVQPGFGGQNFDRRALESLRRLRTMAPPETLLQVDGGVNADTIGPAREAGADLFVVGSAYFRAADRKAALTDLQGRIAAAGSAKEESS